MFGKNKRSDFEIKKGILVKYRGKGGDVTIPEEVTSIGISAFRNCKELRSVTFHGGVVSIGTAAFSDCSNLTRVVFVSGLKKLGVRAFRGCVSLTSVQLPEGLESIGYGAFYECTELSRVTAPDSITRIGNLAFGDTKYFRDAKNEKDGVIYLGNHVLRVNWLINGCVDISHALCVAANAFHGCHHMTEAILPPGLTRLDDEIFHGCQSLSRAVIPEGVQEIGDEVFLECKALESIVFPDGVKKIGDRAFKQSGLTECILPPKLKAIPEECFGRCTALTKVVFPKKLKEIRSSAFHGCESLISVEFPESLEALHTGAFRECKLIGTVHIPAKLTDISSSVFSKCPSLREFTVSENNVRYFSEDGILYDRGVKGDLLCKYPEGKVADVYRMPHNVNRVLYESLGYCKVLKNIIFSPNIKKLVLSDIVASESVCSVTVMDGPDEISVSAFGCKNFTDIYLPERIDNLVIYEWCIENLRMHLTYEQARSRLELGEEKSFISAVKAYIYDRASGILGAEDNAEWRQLIAENLRLCQKNLVDDPDFYTFLTEEKMVSRRVATTMLEKSGSIECRAILLRYLKAVK